MSTAGPGPPGRLGITRAGRWAMAVAAIAAATFLGACADEAGVDPIDEVGVGEGQDGPAEEVPLGGDDPTLADDGVDPGPRADELLADLEITVETDGDEELSQQAILSCGDDEATGILWLQGEAAEEACAALADPSTVAQLDPPDDGQACADTVGGPEVATIVGTIDGVEVDAVVRRSNGCGIERWDALAPLLPEPGAVGWGP